MSSQGSRPAVKGSRRLPHPGVVIPNSTAILLAVSTCGFNGSRQCSKKVVKIVYLPPYLPDLNPIEEFFTEI
jgi:transposase